MTSRFNDEGPLDLTPYDPFFPEEPAAPDDDAAAEAVPRNRFARSAERTGEPIER